MCLSKGQERPSTPVSGIGSGAFKIKTVAQRQTMGCISCHRSDMFAPALFLLGNVRLSYPISLLGNV